MKSCENSTKFLIPGRFLKLARVYMSPSLSMFGNVWIKFSQLSQLRGVPHTDIMVVRVLGCCRHPIAAQGSTL